MERKISIDLILNTKQKTFSNLEYIIIDNMNYYDKNIKNFYFFKEYLDEDIIKTIPFDVTILIDIDSITPKNIYPAVHHFYKIPYIIYEDSNYTLKELSIKDYIQVKSLFDIPDNEYHNVLSYYDFFDCGMYGIFLKSNKLIGLVNIIPHSFSYNQNHYEYELSYTIHNHYQNKGLCTKFSNILMEYININPLYLKIHKNNMASKRIAQKLNFQLILVQNEYEYYVNT